MVDRLAICVEVKALMSSLVRPVIWLEVRPLNWVVVKASRLVLLSCWIWLVVNPTTWVVVNDYEGALVEERTGYRPAEIAARCDVSLDLDVLDPAFCPAVAEPVPGGLSVQELFTLLRVTHRWPAPWVGADIMELAPTLAGAEDSARVAAHIALQLLA